MQATGCGRSSRARAPADSAARRHMRANTRVSNTTPALVSPTRKFHADLAYYRERPRTSRLPQASMRATRSLVVVLVFGKVFCGLLLILVPLILHAILLLLLLIHLGGSGRLSAGPSTARRAR